MRDGATIIPDFVRHLTACPMSFATMMRRARAVLVCLLLVPVVAQAQPAGASIADLSAVPAPQLAARAWIALDVQSGQILASTDPDTSVAPASLTKIMTAYLVFNALKENRITLEQKVSVSETAWRTGGSRMFIEPRKAVTVHELLQGMIVQSGNDASVALAELVAGSEAVFATLMNQEAQKLGMTASHFTNATGLPNPQHVTTVRDLSILAARLIADHPDYYHYYRQRDFRYNDITQPNRNQLLWKDATVDGMKTGHTDAAGYCLVASALRGERRVLTVLVGAASEAARAEESLKLLNWSFQNFEAVRFAGGQSAVNARVWEGADDTAKLGPAEDAWIIVPRGRTSHLQLRASYAEPLLAPLATRQPVGTLAFTLDGRELHRVPLVAVQAVERAGFFGRMFDVVLRWFE